MINVRSGRASARRWSLVASLLAFTGAVTLVAVAQSPRPTPHPRGYVAYRASSPPAIDGRLDDAAWRAAPWSDRFVDIEGDRRPVPRFDTRVKMLWDDRYFYIGADLAEPHLWGTLTEHDSVIFRDHDFEVFIDPNGDNHEYYELEINALGTTWDLLLPKPYKDEGKAVNGWEIAGMKSAVHLDGTLNNPRDTDRGWSVELALPWAALGELARRPSPPRDGDQWRVNFSRVEWTLDIVDGAYRKRLAPAVAGQAPRPLPEQNWVWSPQHVIDMHRPELWGYVQFSTAAPDAAGPSSGARTFIPDPSHAARQWLHQVYYAQREFRKANKLWAASLADLGLRAPADPTLANPTLAVAGSQFEATIDLVRPGQPTERWHIRQDSLIWK